MGGRKASRPPGRKDWYVQVYECGKRNRRGCPEKVNRRRIGMKRTQGKGSLCRSDGMQRGMHDQLRKKKGLRFRP